MWIGLLAAALLLTLSVSEANFTGNHGACKDPTVVHRLLADDVRYASPFYVIALPKTEKTEQIDNVCYTYYETGKHTFFHIVSVVFKNGSHEYHTFSKGDISDRLGLAEATAEKISPCTYHDYTLTPICNVTVFVLYRCFIEGNCDAIDVGITPGVDVRVVLAATPHISDTCRLETEDNLKDTSNLEGGNYVMLPQNLKPRCVIKYGNTTSINPHNALGSITISDENLIDRFAANNEDLVFTGTTLATSTQDDSESTSKSPESSSTQDNNTDSSSQSALPTPTNYVDQRESLLPLFIPSFQPTSQTTLPKKTYADAVKTSSPTKSVVKGKFRCVTPHS